MTNKEQEITWDLTALYPSINDPSIEKAINETKTFADAFEKAYRGKISTLDPTKLLQCLRELESFYVKTGDFSLFASLSFSANMTLPEVQALYDRVSKLEAQLGKQLAFFSLELGALVKAKPEVIAEPVLANYRHMLELVQRRVPHQLTEVEEQLVSLRRTSLACRLGRNCRVNGSTPACLTLWFWAKKRRLTTGKPMGSCLTPTAQHANRRTA
jgi:oligoendopeptidase F